MCYLNKEVTEFQVNRTIKNQINKKISNYYYYKSIFYCQGCEINIFLTVRVKKQT